MSLERQFLRLLEGPTRDPIRLGIRALLRLFSVGYASIIWIRNTLYDIGLMRSEKVSVPVISIGNITTGGTGKTPLTLLLAKELSKHRRVAILSRGYRSRAERALGPTLVLPNMSPSLCGDEALLLARRLPECLVLVHSQRRKSAARAIELGAELLILDDGMQHRALARDIDIAVISSRRCISREPYLPRGMLRDSPRSLKRAQLVVITKASSDHEYEQAVRDIQNWVKCPIVRADTCVSGLEGQVNGSVRGKRVGVFCGIGDPMDFAFSLESEGAHIVSRCFSADHKILPPEELATFAREAARNGAELLVCTEKDWIKLETNIELELPISYLAIQMQITPKHSSWHNLHTTL